MVRTETKLRREQYFRTVKKSHQALVHKTLENSIDIWQKQIGLNFSTLRGDPLFLKIGITVASLSLFGKTPVEKDKFMMSERIFERWYSTIEIKY